jgi:hypothetical protein
MTQPNTHKSIEDYKKEFTENYYSEGEDGGVVFSTGFNGQLIEEWVKEALQSYAEQQVQEAVEEEREEGQKVVFLILPFAKGYVAQNQGGSNRRYIEIAENYLPTLKSKGLDK